MISLREEFDDLMVSGKKSMTGLNMISSLQSSKPRGFENNLVNDDVMAMMECQAYAIEDIIAKKKAASPPKRNK